MLQPELDKLESASSLEELDEETIFELCDAIANGATLKDLRGVSNETMEQLYAFAYDFYQQGRGKEAETFFRFLCLYDMYNADYAMGLAATLQQQKKYQPAIEAYVLAFGLGKIDYRALLHAGQCCLMLKHKEEARKLFLTIMESASATSVVKAQAQAYLDALQPLSSKEA